MKPETGFWIFGQKVRLPGPPEILENQYETAKRWVEFERACAREKDELYLEKSGIPYDRRRRSAGFRVSFG